MYTKGEWKVADESYTGDLFIKTVDNKFVALANKANAQLIASAPDLYRACKRAEQMLQYPQALSNEAKNYELEDLRKALSKAEGKDE